MAVVVLLVLLPLLPVLLWAVADTWRYPDLLPGGLTGRGLRLVTGSSVLGALGTSTLIATAVACLACAVGFPAGRALGMHSFRGRRVVQFLLLAPVLVPALAVTLGLQVFFIRLGLADTVTGVVLVQLMPTVPYAATLLGASYANLDADHERQARVLGAGPWRTVAAVTVPLLRPALVTTWLLTFLISWSEYILTLLIGGGRVTTLPLLLFSAIESSDRTAAAALGLLVVLPPVLLVLVVARLLGSRDDAFLGVARA
ncbi:ABC transporter permease subunit [Nocardioides sp. MJB4]|uniref:ABC transporter permease subunit n=1 Tax=Nocardioides donggukensis TaxID=2774019 RepID=A0A927K3E9_9ACTN|nr:ABC transporter permease subunit [Nocardioides donggukensis]